MSKREITPVAAELIAAKKRIEDPDDCWWDGSFRNCQKGIEPLCAITAVKKGSLITALNKSARAVFGAEMTAIKVNDKLGHAAVMQMYDHAIQRALNEGKYWLLQADAKLIAAAPALLEALKVAERAIDDCQNYRGHLHHKELAQVRAAIALAEQEGK